MYPNMQDVLPLPARPDVEQYRKRAKELTKACISGERGALHEWTKRWVTDLARLAGPADSSAFGGIEHHAEQIAEFAHVRLTRAGCALSEAQFIIARAHGFLSWPKLVHHLEELAARASGTATFEDAVEAIVAGDIATLERLLRDNPSLVRARSTREHRSTLLHYVAANGVENYRQKTPPNIVAVARLLLDAGAEVDAEADMYGGGATTLGLVVTSAHPRAMGVQNALADLLLERGAKMGNPVHGCLMNGCPEAAEHLVRRGAPVNSMEEAAGIGQLALVRQFWNAGRTADAESALRMAAWYGRGDVADFLLSRGVGPEARDAKDGDTALHIASFNGHADVVRMLLQRGADVNAIDDVYRTPPLVWALHAWLVENRKNADDYRAALIALVDSGASVNPEWIDDPRLSEDSALWTALTRGSR
ncbi:MAG: ankyrin repeat domain-containing protein [Gemmatimonadaceae bacterium]